MVSPQQSVPFIPAALLHHSVPFMPVAPLQHSVHFMPNQVLQYPVLSREVSRHREQLQNFWIQLNNNQQQAQAQQQQMQAILYALQMMAGMEG